jgi:hypothetical protein
VFLIELKTKTIYGSISLATSLVGKMGGWRHSQISCLRFRIDLSYEGGVIAGMQTQMLMRGLVSRRKYEKTSHVKFSLVGKGLKRREHQARVSVTKFKKNYNYNATQSKTGLNTKSNLIFTIDALDRWLRHSLRGLNVLPNKISLFLSLRLISIRHITSKRLNFLLNILLRE